MGPPSPPLLAGQVLVLKRKEVGNPPDYFDKTFAEYKEGFASRGESWVGLQRLHTLTSQGSYKLKITMTDFDGKMYVAVYDQFKVGPEEDDYVLTLGGFNYAQSTLGNSMGSHARNSNGMKFTTKDRDNDIHSSLNCAQRLT